MKAALAGAYTYSRVPLGFRLQDWQIAALNSRPVRVI